MSTQSDIMNRLVCPACGALNRAQSSRKLSNGACGRCKETLATPIPIEINAILLERLRSRDTGAFVIDVWAPWCGPCRMMAPAYDKAAAQLSDQIRFFKLNSDEHQSAAATLGIRGVPTLIAYDGGTQIGHKSGAPTGDGLIKWIQTTFTKKD